MSIPSAVLRSALVAQALILLGFGIVLVHRAFEPHCAGISARQGGQGGLLCEGFLDHGGLFFLGEALNRGGAGSCQVFQRVASWIKFSRCLSLARGRPPHFAERSVRNLLIRASALGAAPTEGRGPDTCRPRSGPMCHRSPCGAWA